jgi:hypothetical protein
VPQWQAWLTEVAVGLRTVLFKLPYGDQALFVHRGALEALQVRAAGSHQHSMLPTVVAHTISVLQPELVLLVIYI